MRLGDPVAALLAYLRADSAMQALTPWTLSTDLVGWDEAAPWATLQRTAGGTPPPVPALWMRSIRMQLDVYGPSMESTGILGEQILETAYKINQVSYKSAFGVAICDIAIDMDLGWLPDPQTAKPRWTALLSVGCVPIPTP